MQYLITNSNGLSVRLNSNAFDFHQQRSLCHAQLILGHVTDIIWVCNQTPGLTQPSTLHGMIK